MNIHFGTLEQITEFLIQVGLADYTAMLAGHTVRKGNDVVIYTDESSTDNSVTLKDTLLSELSAANLTITGKAAMPSLSVDDVTTVEGEMIVFTISLDAVSSEDVTVEWAVSDGTATVGRDYQAESGQSLTSATTKGRLTIPAGEQFASVWVQTIDDNGDEDNETFTITLSAPTNATLGDATGEATITDNDEPPPTLEDHPSRPDGGQAAEVPDHKDYSELIGKVWGYATETHHGQAHVDRWMKVLSALGIQNDYEPMSASEAQTYADRGWTRWDPVVEALTEIEAGQQEPPTPPVASIDDVTAVEGEMLVFTISLDAVSGQDVTIEWTVTDGTATEGRDYNAQGGSSVRSSDSLNNDRTLTIPAGERFATLWVQTIDDKGDEDDETFTITLSAPTNATLGDATGEATIIDNDEPPPTLEDHPSRADGGQAVEVLDHKDYSELIAKVWGYATETHHGQAHVDRWMKVLSALGVQNDYDPMTASEAQIYADRGWTRWDPVVEALTEIEAAQSGSEAEDAQADTEPDPWDHNGLTLTGTEGLDDLFGSENNDLIDGRGGMGYIYGGFGDDRMTCGEGLDSFNIYGNSGRDVITDFNFGEGDRLNLIRVGFADFDEMLANHIEQDGDNLVIYTDPSTDQSTDPSGKQDCITLLDTKLKDLDKLHFSIFKGTAPTPPSSTSAPDQSAQAEVPTAVDLFSVEFETGLEVSLEEDHEDTLLEHWPAVSASYVEI